MSYTDDFLKGMQKRKKKNNYTEETTDIAPIRSISTFSSPSINRSYLLQKEDEDDISPVEDRTWFKTDLLKDSWESGDIGKTILGSIYDVQKNVNAGILGIGEKVVDTGAYLAGGIGSIFGQKEFASDMREFVKKDLYDEEKLADTVLSYSAPFNPQLLATKLLGADDESHSVFGEKTDSLAQSGGQALARAGLQMAGVPWYVTSGVTSFGSEVENAFNKDASYGEAGISAAISAGAEILSGMLFSGSGLGEKSLINLEPLTKGISNKIVKTLVDWGLDMASEGSEEVVSSIAQNVGASLTYLKEDEWGEILTDESKFDNFLENTMTNVFGMDALHEYSEAFVGGFSLGGGMNVGKVSNSISTGRDYRTGLTTNEQSVVDKLFKDEVAKAEKDGSVSKKDKAKIYDDIINKLDRGEIDTDTIESVLGGESFEGYKSLTEQETALKDEIEALENTPESQFTIKQRERLTEAREQLAKLDTKTAKSNLFSEVDKLTQKDTRLRESYNEKARRGQAFETDLTKYDAKQQAVIKKAVDSKILNNSRRTHEFVDMIAKISAEKGVLFDFTNNKKLKESGFALDGKTVNGFVTKDGVTLNMQSEKALSSVVGHEITHVLEGTELYTELQKAVTEYAKIKNDYQGRLDSITKLYEGVEGANIDAELTADLVGDYLFTDADFVNNLSTKHRNVFQKIYDEVKYLYKIATAGSKEARQLEQVKKIFDDAYRNGGKAQKNTADSGVQYDIAALDNGNVYVTASRNVIKGSTKAEQRNEITNFFSALLDGKPSLDIQTIEGDVLTITKKETANKARDDYKTVNGQQIPMTDAEFTVKMHVESHIDEVAEVSKSTNNAQDNKNHPFAKDGFTYRRAYFEDFDGQYYEVTLSIGHNGTIATVYNVGKIKGSVPPSAKVIAVVGSKPLGGTLTDADISQNGKKVKGQFSLSEDSNGTPNGKPVKEYGNYNVYGKDISLAQEVAPTKQAQNDPVIPKEEMFEDYAPDESLEAKVYRASENIQNLENEIDTIFSDHAEQRISDEEFQAKYMDVDARYTEALLEHERLTNEATALDNERFANISESDIPPEMEAPYPGEVNRYAMPPDPFRERDRDGVGNRKVKAYMHEHPEVKPFFQSEAYKLMQELADHTPGERWYDDRLYYESGGERGWGGTKRNASQSLVTMLDSWRMTKTEIQNGLEAIIEGNGAENVAAAKKIEFMLNERLYNGYKDFYTGKRVPPNKAYINMLIESQITDYSDQAFNSFMETADAYAPPVEDIAPVKPVKPVKPVENIAPTVENENGQRAMYEGAQEGKPKRTTRAELHAKIIDRFKNVFKAHGKDLDSVLKNAKNLSTFSTVDNTPQRVMEKALGYDDGQILSDLTVNKVAQNETSGIKWLNSFTNRKNGLLSQISKQYNIKPGSKESAAAQMYAEGFYVAKNNDIIAYGDAELAQDFPNAKVRNNIKGLASDPRIRKIYDDTLNAINESRTRNAYPEIPRLDNYFLHFRAMEDTFSKLGLPFNPNDIRAKDLPTDLNGVTADLKPGQPYFASAMHRTGKRTSFDLLGGLEKYLTSAKNQIYHIDDIQSLRALRNYIADTYGQAHGLENLDTLSEEAAQAKIEAVYGSHLSTFAKFLNEEANVLAGKTSMTDRAIEHRIGRRGITLLDTINKQVGANMVGFNVSSALTNFIPVTQAFAKTNKFDFLKAFAQTASNKVGSLFGKSDGFMENNPTAIRRQGADRFYRTPWQKATDFGYVFMGAVDNISTELIVRTKYNELTRKGMSEQRAIVEADKWASRLMGDRSLGQQPQMYNSKMDGIVTKFQLEVRNQLDAMIYDTIQEKKASNKDIENALARNAKTAAQVTSTFVQLAVAQHLFGKAFESVAGYNPAFDIIEAIMAAAGWDDEEDSEDTVTDNLWQGFQTLLGDLPYANLFMDGGRIPMSAALPIGELISGEDKYGNEKPRWQTLVETAPYYLLPTGYGQIKKTTQGLGMFSEDHPIAGSYTDSGNLRFPVEDTLQNRIHAGIFGQWANENARDYFDNERNPLKEKQIQEFIDVDIPIQDYWEYREGLAKLDKLEEKFDYIAGLDLPVEKKNILINNIVDRKEAVDIGNYDDFSGYEEFDFATKNPERYEFLQSNNVSYSDYIASEESREAYNWAYKNPEGYTLSKAVADDVVTYRQYASDLYDIKADKDADGKSISGSRKAKVIDYINSLDADYGAKIILFKSEYPSDDTYNFEIVEYLNTREDISYDEMETILKELGFTVDSQGNISWD